MSPNNLPNHLRDSEKPKILMVDDKPENLVVLDKILASLNANLYKATSGNEALALTLEHDFMLVLLDVQMPGMDGYEVLEAMSYYERTKYIPVIFITANYADENHQLKGYQYGAVDYLFKPINKSILLGKIKVFIELHKQKMAYKALQQRYQLILDSAGEGIFGLNVDGKINFINPAAASMLGRDVKDFLDQSFSILLPARYTRAGQQFIWEESDVYTASKTGNVLNNKDTLFIKADKSELPVEYTATPVQNEDREYIGVVVVFSDITLKKAIEEQLTHLALYDHLTQLPNRLLFEKSITQALARADRHRRLIAVMFLDLDHFKTINDTLGHDIGDLLLKGVAERLLVCARATDIVARLGGDEFAIILDEIDKPEDAVVVAEKIIDILKPVFTLNTHEVFVTTSIGIAIYPLSGEDSVSLIKNADIAMYRAKHQGRNNYRFFTSGMNEKSMHRLNLAHALRHAQSRDQLYFFYQPKFELKTGKIMGVEALLRWQHPDFGLVLPHEFIPIAEEIGIMSGLGEWILKAVFEENQKWLRDPNCNIRIAVNLSGAQLLQNDLQTLIQAALAEINMPPSKLELELTETVLMSNRGQSARILNSLHDLGIHISIDDFGTGYSSLSYLKSLPVDTLKIDKSFIHEVPTDTNDKAIVRAIIAMAHSMELNVVAEGVENEAQRDFLLENGCNEVQGFLYSKPLNYEQLSELLKHSFTFTESI